MAAHDLPSGATQRGRQWLPRLAAALGLGLLGAAINNWPLDLGRDTNLWLGNFAYILVAARLRAPYAAVAGLLSGVPLCLQWGLLSPAFGCALEAVVVAVLRGRGMQVFYADVLYWLLAGMPATAVALWLGELGAPQEMFYICLKQAFNGVVCSSLAGVLLILAPGGARFAWCQQPALQRTHRDRLIYAVSIVTAFSIATSSLVVSRWMVRYQESLVLNSLRDIGGHLERQVEEYLALHVRTIEVAARWLSLTQDPAERMQRMLVATHEAQPGFLTMLVSDATGRIVAASPATRMATLRSDYSVADRDYFREAMRTRQVYLSPVFRGRGFGSDPIVAISKAYFRGDEGGAPLGIIEGSLNLSQFEEVVRAELVTSPIRVVLVDADGRVIHASPGLGFEALQAFAFEPPAGSRGARAGTVSLREGSARPVTYLVDTVELDNGWKIYALLAESELTTRISQQYVAIFLLLTASIVVASLLAERTGRRLTAPLEAIARDLAVLDAPGEMRLGNLPSDASREVAVVHAELRRNMGLVAEYRSEMEARIAARTQELQDANRKLQALASADPLTGLHNRRSMEERFGLIRGMAERSGLQIAVVLLDLDHFKQLNDRHGHLVGDQCLLRVAGLMQDEFRRATDVAARFGGEEFVLVAAAMNRDNLAAKLETLRLKIAAQELVTEDGARVRFTASFGALITGATFSARLDDWLRVADGCLYRAKAAGRNAVVIETGAPAGDS